MSSPDFLFSHNHQAAEDDVVSITPGAPCASVIIAAWLMMSAAKTTNLSAPQVRPFSQKMLLCSTFCVADYKLL